MSRDHLELPVLQNWSCHNCGGCCREHLIEITAEEKQRIEKQGWQQKDFNVDGPLIQSLGKKSFRLAHQPDGACVFLNNDGLCRIHAEFGEAAKPLACRVYPYAYHPSGSSKIAVSLRFSCPSVVQNAGQPVVDQQSELSKVAREIVKGKRRDHDPPLIHRQPPHGAQQTGWPDFHRFLTALDAALADESVQLKVRLLRILAWLQLVERSQFETITGSKLDEFLQLITSASVKAQPDNDLPERRPNRMGRILFRLLAGQLARHDTAADARQGLSIRWQLLATALKLSTGIGTVPVEPTSESVRTAFPVAAEQRHPVRFADLERPFDCSTEQIDQLLTRYFRVKVQGIHFCGPAHYDTPLVDGFRSLALMYPTTLWLARIRAAQSGGDRVSLTDVQAALATADHNFGYSPALGMASAQKRVTLLSNLDQLTALIAWYGQ
jgi:lysine-N-methylase